MTTDHHYVNYTSNIRGDADISDTEGTISYSQLINSSAREKRAGLLNSNNISKIHQSRCTTLHSKTNMAEILVQNGL